jgi:hypothetical protein
MRAWVWWNGIKKTPVWSRLYRTKRAAKEAGPPIYGCKLYRVLVSMCRYPEES